MPAHRGAPRARVEGGRGPRRPLRSLPPESRFRARPPRVIGGGRSGGAAPRPPRCSSERVDEVDELPEPGVGRAVEWQDEPWQLRELVELLLDRPWRLLCWPLENVVEPALELRHLVVRERVNEAQHELVADDPRRVVDAVKACDLAHRVLDRLRDAVEARVDRVDEPPLDQRARGPSVPDPPERLRPGLDEHDGDDRRLARLDERQELEGLVHRAVAAREERDRARLLHEEELAREEVLECDELRVGGDPRVRLLLERQPDVEPEALLAAGALLRGAHDPAAGAREDHPALGDHAPAELARGDRGVLAGLRARGAEHADLADAAVRREDLEPVT